MLNFEMSLLNIISRASSKVSSSDFSAPLDFEMIFSTIDPKICATGTTPLRRIIIFRMYVLGKSEIVTNTNNESIPLSLREMSYFPKVNGNLPTSSS
jgi:hypothetical protein